MFLQFSEFTLSSYTTLPAAQWEPCLPDLVLPCRWQQGHFRKHIRWAFISLHRKPGSASVAPPKEVSFQASYGNAPSQHSLVFPDIYWPLLAPLLHLTVLSSLLDELSLFMPGNKINCYSISQGTEDTQSNPSRNTETITKNPPFPYAICKTFPRKGTKSTSPFMQAQEYAMFGIFHCLTRGMHWALTVSITLHCLMLHCFSATAFLII